MSEEKLDLDDLIEEVEKEESTDSAKQEETPEKKPEKDIKKEEEEEGKKSRKNILPLIINVILLIIILIFSYFSYKEYGKKPPVKSEFFLINKKIIYITPKKIEQAKIQKYNFNLLIAYKFPSINGAQILKATVSADIYSMANIPLKKLYFYISTKIYNDFQQLTKNKYIEDIPDYRSKIKSIILNDTITILQNSIPDINIEKIKKNLKFVEFILFSG